MAEVAVFGVADEGWGEVVSAAVVARSALSARELVDFARGHLAGYKLPRRVHLVDELPKTTSGKLSEKDLRAQYS